MVTEVHMMWLKFTTLLLMTVLFSVRSHSQVEVIWERSEAQGNKPTWFGTNTERGMGYGVVEGNERIYVASRSGGTINIRILDATLGEDVGTLPMDGISGGLFPINDVDVSSDGIIFACNMTINAATDAFKVYKWTSESTDPTAVIAFTSQPYRLGDKFTVTGAVDDNSITIYAAASIASPSAASSRYILRFTTEDNARTFTYDVIELKGEDGVGVVQTGIHPSVGPLAPGDAPFYFNASAGAFMTEWNPTLFFANGEFVGRVPGNFTNTNSIRYFTWNGNEYIVTFRSESGANYAIIFNVSAGPEQADSVAATPSLGGLPNDFESGDVAVTVNDEGRAIIYVLGGNNGLGGYSLDLTAVHVEATADQMIPSDFRLYQNFPNPFNPATTITYSIPETEFVTLAVYNILGQRIATLVNSLQQPGTYHIHFDASDLPSGVYVYRLETESFTATQKMILQK